MSQDAARPNPVSPAPDLREFFREQLDGAITRQKVGVQDETGAYLVNLLVEFISTDTLYVRDEDGSVTQEPLAFILKRAVEAPPAQRERHLRRLGDTALYVSGFFSDSLSRKLVDVDYYAQMGGRAYGTLAGMSRHGGRKVFQELAEKFLRVADVLSEISERAAVTSNSGILRLYERYARTGSERLRRLLADRGVLAAPAPLEPQ